MPFAQNAQNRSGTRGKSTKMPFCLIRHGKETHKIVKFYKKVREVFLELPLKFQVGLRSYEEDLSKDAVFEKKKPRHKFEGLIKLKKPVKLDRYVKNKQKKVVKSFNKIKAKIKKIQGITKNPLPIVAVGWPRSWPATPFEQFKKHIFFFRFFLVEPPTPFSYQVSYTPRPPIPTPSSL